MSAPVTFDQLRADQLIGMGRTAQVFLWRDGTVLKLFKPSVRRSEIEAEAIASSAAFSLGLPAPRIVDIIEIQGSFGLVLERATGTSMLSKMLEGPPQIEEYARVLAQLHAQIHSNQAPATLPDQSVLLRTKIRCADLSPVLTRRILGCIDELPAETYFCHGDFHPGNIMIGGLSYKIIDWNDASRGCPVLDVARTSVILLGAAVHGPKLFNGHREFVETLHTCYLHEYFALKPEVRPEYERCLPLAAAARLSESVGGESQWLRSVAEQCAI